MEYVVMDYEGEPTIIEDGEMWIAERPYDADREIYADWDSEECEWEFEPEDEYPAESLSELERQCWQWDRL